MRGIERKGKGEERMRSSKGTEEVVPVDKTKAVVKERWDDL